MSEFLDYVKQRKNAPEAIAHRVALYVSASDRRAIITEAGDDICFYAALLRRMKSLRKVEFSPAHGRDKVVSVLLALQRMGKASNTFGIVDRDLNLDDPKLIFENRCLVLDVYSFENFLPKNSFWSKSGESFSP